jgi:hypothetical protein
MCTTCKGKRCIPTRFASYTQGNESQSLKELEDLRHLYAHNYAGDADDQYFHRTRHVLQRGVTTQLTCGAAFDGYRPRLDLTHFRMYSCTVRSVLERFPRCCVYRARRCTCQSPMQVQFVLAHRRGPSFANRSVEIVRPDATLKTLCIMESPAKSLQNARCARQKETPAEAVYPAVSGTTWRCRLLRPLRRCLARLNTKSGSGRRPRSHAVADVVAARDLAHRLA